MAGFGVAEVVWFLRLADDVYGGHVERFERFSVFVRVHGNVHVGPKVVGQVVIDGFGEVEVLKLGEGLQGGGGNDVDAKDLG